MKKRYALAVLLVLLVAIALSASLVTANAQRHDDVDVRRLSYPDGCA